MGTDLIWNVEMYFVFSYTDEDNICLTHIRKHSILIPTELFASLPLEISAVIQTYAKTMELAQKMVKRSNVMYFSVWRDNLQIRYGPVWHLSFQ